MTDHPQFCYCTAKECWKSFGSLKSAGISLKVPWDSEMLIWIFIRLSDEFTLPKNWCIIDLRFCAVSPFCDSTDPSDPANNHQWVSHRCPNQQWTIIILTKCSLVIHYHRRIILQSVYDPKCTISLHRVDFCRGKEWGCMVIIEIELFRESNQLNIDL